MTAYSSTTISLMSRHCPAALDYLQRGTPRDDVHVFHVGVSAHAVLEALGRAVTAEGRYLLPDEVERVAAGPVAQLVESGYTFAGEQQPPLPFDDVFEGRDLALAYQAEVPISPGGQYEIGWAADRDWRPVPYDSPEARWRAVVDRVDEGWVGDEEGGAPGVIVTDYKTSWSASHAELRTIQRRGQAVLASLHRPRAAAIRLSVVGVRSRWTYSTGDGGGAPEDIYPDEPEGQVVLDRWKRDLTTLMDIADRQAGKRPHVPGRGCLGCPFYSRCDHGREYWRGWHPTNAPEVLAAEWVAAKAAADAIRTQLEPLADECGMIPAAGGGSVGWMQKPGLHPTKDASREIAKAWSGGKEMSEDLVAGLVKALSPSAAQIKALAGKVYADEEAAATWVRTVTVPKHTRRWEVQRDTAGDGNNKEGEA